jgi:fluoride exporter
VSDPDPPRRAGVLAAVAAGGLLGAPARYGLSVLLPPAPGRFPWATFVVNVSGSLGLGALLVLVRERRPDSRYLRPFAATGFLGSYTTFSTFAVEVRSLLADRQVALALAYALGSLLAGVAAAGLGGGVGGRATRAARSRAE